MQAGFLITESDMKFKVLLVAVMLSSPVFALDKNSGHYKAAVSLMDAADATTMLRQARKQMQVMLGDRMDQLETKIPENKVEEFETYKRNVSGLMRKNMRWSTLKDEFAELYMDIYTESELQQLAKFYNSPVGKKFVEKTPELMGRTMQIMQSRMAAAMPEIQKLTQELQASVKTAE